MTACVFVHVCAQVPLQVERPSLGGWKLHRGSIHTSAPLSPAQGRTHTHMQIQRGILSFNAGFSVFLCLIATLPAMSGTVFLLVDKWLLRRCPPNDEAPRLVYGMASATTAGSLYWLMQWACVCVCACMCLGVFDLFCLFISFMGHLQAHRERQSKGSISGFLSPPLSV